MKVMVLELLLFLRRKKIEIKGGVLKFYLTQVLNVVICILFILYGYSVWGDGVTMYRSSPFFDTVIIHAGPLAKLIGLLFMWLGFYLLYCTVIIICRK